MGHEIVLREREWRLLRERRRHRERGRDRRGSRMVETDRRVNEIQLQLADDVSSVAVVRERESEERVRQAAHLMSQITTSTP
jgi:hypothetical protein